MKLVLACLLASACTAGIAAEAASALCDGAPLELEGESASDKARMSKKPPPRGNAKSTPATPRDAPRPKPPTDRRASEPATTGR